MDIPFQEQVINYLSEANHDTVYQEEVAELLLSESMPKIERLIDCSGALFIQRKDVSADSVTVTGEVKARILYQTGESEQLQVTEKTLPFSVRKELVKTDSVQTVFYRGWVRQIDAKLLGDRKLLIRADIGSLFTAFVPSSFTVHRPTEQPKTLQLLKNTYELMLPADCGEKEFRLNEETVLPDTAAGVSELLKTTVSLCVRETKTVGDKVVLKGTALLHILYASEAGTLHVFDTELPFSQFVELGSEAEEADARVFMQQLSCEVETDGQPESGRLYVNLSILAQAAVYRKQRVDLYEDAFATKGVLSAQWQEIAVRARLDSQAVAVGAELSVPAMAEKVIEATIFTDQPMLRRDSGMAKVLFPVSASVMYLDKDGTLQSRKTKGEVTYEMPLADSAECTAAGAIFDMPTCLASYDTVTVRTVGQLQVDSFMGSSLKTVKSASIEPSVNVKDEQPSLIVRKAGKESVWEIAKMYGSTVDAICDANGLMTGSVQEGAILLIPMQ